MRFADILAAQKTMLETLYSKKLNEDASDEQVIVGNEHIYCPVCHRSNMLDDLSKEYECYDFNVAEFRCKHCGKVHYVKLNRWHSSTKPEIVRRRNTKKYGNKALQYTRVSCPYAKLTNEIICIDRDSGKIIVFMRYLNIIPTKTHLVFEPYFDKYILNYKNHTAYMVKHKTYSGKKAFGYRGAPLINITNARYGLWNSYISYWPMSVELLETLMRVYFDVANIPLYEMFMQFAQASKREDDINLGDYKIAILETIMTMNRCPSLLIDYDAYTNNYKRSYSISGPFFSKSFSKDFPKTIVDKQKIIRDMVKKYNVPNSTSFWKLYLDDIAYLDKAIYFKQCGFNNPDVIRSLIVNETFLSDIEKDANMNYFSIHELVESCDKFRQVVKKMNSASKEQVVANRLIHMGDCYYMQDIVRMYHKIRRHDVKLLKTIDWSRSMKEIHDDLSLMNNKLQYVNTPINYNIHEKMLEMNVDDCVFKLPVDTNELVAIGQEMKICVGSYRDQVLAKRSIIVSIKRDDQYVGCIELDNAFNLYQVKGKRNTYLVGDVGNAAIKWVKNAGIKNAKHSNDFLNIGQEIKDEYDYHHLELDNDGNVVQVRRIPRAIVVNPDFNDQRNDVFDFDEDLPF